MFLSDINSHLSAVVKEIPRGRLEGFLSRLGRGQGLRVALLAESLGRQDERLLETLEQYVKSGLVSSEFLAASLEALYDSRASLPAAPLPVWTGPKLSGGTDYTHTLVACRSVVESSKSRILIAGYCVTIAAIERLGLTSAIARGVTVDVIVNSQELVESDYLAMVVQGLRVFRAAPSAADYSKFHVKAIVADGSTAIVGSANFTSLGQSQNIELGMMMSGAAAIAIESILDDYLGMASATGWVIR